MQIFQKTSKFMQIHSKRFNVNFENSKKIVTKVVLNSIRNESRNVNTK